VAAAQPAAASAAAAAAAAALAAKKKSNKKKKKRLPKGYPDCPPPNPERWLPRTERKGYKSTLAVGGSRGAHAMCSFIDSCCWRTQSGERRTTAEPHRASRKATPQSRQRTSCAR